MDPVAAEITAALIWAVLTPVGAVVLYFLTVVGFAHWLHKEDESQFAGIWTGLWVGWIVAALWIAFSMIMAIVHIGALVGFAS